MKLRLRLFFTITIFLLFNSLAFAVSNKSNIKAMILTGQNNHKWKASSPALKKILEQTHLFQVDLAASPAQGENMDLFNPDFASYDVVVLDYNGNPWSEKTKKAFVEYVNAGGGVVVLHAANNAFADWENYLDIIGLGGMGGHDENSGTYVYWDGEKIIRDAHPGIAGKHGKLSPFQVITREKNHPITRGLPFKWMHATDELYGQLRGPANDLTVLATAYADPLLDGSGRHEPVLFTVNYGSGRIFHTVLGHVDGRRPYPAIECAGFIVTLQRGAEWAATGKVTQEIPADFPNAVTVRRWAEYKPPVFAALLDSIASYNYGQDRENLTTVAEMIAVSPRDSKHIKEIEKRLCEFLKSDATLASKEFVCRQLSQFGTDLSVSTLASMLYTPEMFDMARYTLERIPGAKVDKVLQKSLAKLDGKNKAGIILTLGNRRDLQSVDLLARYIYDSDPHIATASAVALGEIGDKKSTKILAKAKKKVQGPNRTTILDAMLECANQFMILGKTDKALAIYKELFAPSEPAAIRSAAFRGMVCASEKEAGDLIVKAINTENSQMQAVAISLVNELSEPQAIKAIVSELSHLSVANQTRLLLALAGHPYDFVRQAVTTATESADTDVRIAALKALGDLGDQSSILLLARKASTAKGVERQTARESLYRLKGQDINEIIIANISDLAEKDNKIKLELIRAVDNRRIFAAADILIESAQVPDRKVRIASIKVLKLVADGQDVPTLIDLLLEALTETERKELEKTIVSAALKMSRDSKSDAVVDVLPSVKKVETRASLLMVLGKLGERKSLPVLKSAITDANKDLQLAAIIALSDWPNDEPKEELYKIATSATDDEQRVLALRGYIHLIGLENDRPANETNLLYEKAMNVAVNDTDKKMVLTGLAGVKTLDALSMAAEYLDNELLQAEAEAAVIEIAGNINDSYPEQCKALLLTVIEKTNFDPLRQKAQQVLNVIERFDDYITLWQLSGPYVDEDVNIFEYPFGPEDPDAKDVTWIVMPENSDENNYWHMNLNKVLGGVDRTAYLKTTVFSKVACQALLELGSNDGVKVWLNGEMIHANDTGRGVTPGEDVVEVTLKEGKNTLLMKIVNGGGGWGACARFRRPDGGKLEGSSVELGD